MHDFPWPGGIPVRPAEHSACMVPVRVDPNLADRLRLEKVHGIGQQDGAFEEMPLRLVRWSTSSPRAFHDQVIERHRPGPQLEIVFTILLLAISKGDSDRGGFTDVRSIIDKPRPTSIGFRSANRSDDGRDTGRNFYGRAPRCARSLAAGLEGGRRSEATDHREHKPHPAEVIVNFPALWADQGFREAAEDYRRRRGREAEALFDFVNRQAEIVLHARLHSHEAKGMVADTPAS